MYMCVYMLMLNVSSRVIYKCMCEFMHVWCFIEVWGACFIDEPSMKHGWCSQNFILNYYLVALSTRDCGMTPYTVYSLIWHFNVTTEKDISMWINNIACCFTKLQVYCSCCTWFGDKLCIMHTNNMLFMGTVSPIWIEKVSNAPWKKKQNLCITRLSEHG